MRGFIWVVAVCVGEHFGHVVAQGFLTEAYKAYNMAGGLMAWAEAGLPLETGPLSS